jgi:hypothetical protein
LAQTRRIQVHVDVDPELYKRFKQAISMRWGGKKGDMSRALIEAIENWIRETLAAKASSGIS